MFVWLGDWPAIWLQTIGREYISRGLRPSELILGMIPNRDCSIKRVSGASVRGSAAGSLAICDLLFSIAPWFTLGPSRTIGTTSASEGTLGISRPCKDKNYCYDRDQTF